MPKWGGRGAGGRFVSRESAAQTLEEEQSFISGVVRTPIPRRHEDLPPGEAPPIPGPDPAWDYYWPTPSINPTRPRTLQARYSSRLQKLEIKFRNGQSYHYDEIPKFVWSGFRRAESPGKYINSTLNDFPYGPGGWGTLEE